MSKITTAHTNLLALVASTLSSAKRIPDPYTIDKCAGRILDYGYAVAFGPGENARNQLTCHALLRRDFAVVLTRRVNATENDATKQSDAALALLEDQYLVIKAFETNTGIGISDVSFLADSGIEILTTEEGRYYVLTSTFRGTYLENLNA